MNTVMCIGRLVGKPETVPLGDNFSVTKFRVVVDGDPVKDKDGNVKKDDNGYTVKRSWWANCKVLGKRGEAVEKYFDDKDMIVLTGTMETESWDDKNTGEKRYKDILMVDRFSFAAKGKNSDLGDVTTDEKPAEKKKGRPKKETKPVENNQDDEHGDNEIPF
jgi:single-strand DNA-binding protein